MSQLRTCEEALSVVLAAVVRAPRMRSSSLLNLLLFAPSTMSFGGPLREIKDPNTFSALAFVPPGAEGPMPLLLYLHGAGESGTSVRDLISEGATSTRRAPTIAGEGVTPHLSNANRWSGALTRAPLPRSRELPSRVMTTDNPPLRQDNGPTCTRGEPHFRHAWSRNVNNRVPIASRQPRWRHDSKEAARTCAHA